MFQNLNKVDKYIIAISLCIALFLFFIFQYFTFSKDFSNELVHWFYFAGFIGGTIGTILSGIGLYFAIKSLSISLQINKESAQLQRKIAEHMYFSLPDVAISSNEKGLECTLINKGNSPLVIKKLDFSRKGKVNMSVKELFIDLGISINSQAISDIELESSFNLAPNESKIIFSLKTSRIFEILDLKNLANDLSRYDLLIQYLDGLNADSKKFRKSFQAINRWYQNKSDT